LKPRVIGMAPSLAGFDALLVGINITHYFNNIAS
jgi:hypothetical protein